MAENYIGNALSQIGQLKQQSFQNNLAANRDQRDAQLQGLQINQLQTNQAAQAKKVDWEKAIAGSRFVQAGIAKGAEPKALVEQVAPQFIQDFESHHGQGSWAQITPEQILPMAQGIEQHAMAQLGQGPQPQQYQTVKKDEVLLPRDANTGVVSSTPAYGGQTKPTIGNVNPGDFTPDSVSKYQQSGNYSDLVRTYQPAEGSGAAASSIDAYKSDPALRRTAAIVVASDPARMRDYATFGAAGQGIRTAINQEIGQVKKETGMSDADFVSLRSRAKADASNLTKLTAQNSQIEQAEGLMKQNGQRALELINMIDQTGIPLIEGFRRSAKAKMGGVNEAELESVMTAFQAEVARLLTSGPTMNGVLSDSARAEVAHMSPKSMSADQAKRVINRIFTEADIRHGLNLEQISKASSGTVVGAQTTQQAQPAQAPQSEVTATGPNGKKIVLRNGQWVPM